MEKFISELNNLEFKKLGATAFVSTEGNYKTYVYKYKDGWQVTRHLHNYVNGTLKKKYEVTKFENCPIQLQIEK